MRDLTDVYFPRAERIRVVLDNLSTHSVGGRWRARYGDLGAVLADVGAADVAGGVIVRRRGVGDVACTLGNGSLTPI
jgi:virulence-associated protein VapD